MPGILSKIKNAAKDIYRYRISDKGFRADIDKKQANEAEIARQRLESSKADYVRTAPTPKPIKKFIPLKPVPMISRKPKMEAEPMNHYEKVIRAKY